jgi:hypothetical protein
MIRSHLKNGQTGKEKGFETASNGSPDGELIRRLFD